MSATPPLPSPTNRIAPDGIDFPLGKKLAEDLTRLNHDYTDLQGRLRHTLGIHWSLEPRYHNRCKPNHNPEHALGWLSDFMGNDCLALHNYVRNTPEALAATRLDIPARDAESANLKRLAALDFEAKLGLVPRLQLDESTPETDIFSTLRQRIDPKGRCTPDQPGKRKPNLAIAAINRVEAGVIAVQADIKELLAIHTAAATAFEQTAATCQSARAAG